MDFLKTIIFIGTNKSGSSREAIRAAGDLGYFTVLFTSNEKQLRQREEYKDVHEMVQIETTDIKAMKKKIAELSDRGLAIKSILSFVDSYVHIASALQDEFCTNVASTVAVTTMENKAATRELLKNYPFTPKHSIIQPEEWDTYSTDSMNLGYPVIVKSPHSTGSKDVLLAKNSKQLAKHMNKLHDNSPENPIILEEYIEGEQYLVEALIHKGTVKIAGFMKQEVTAGKRFIITGYGVMVDVPEMMKSPVEQIIKSIVKRFGMENGAMHLELRRSPKGWKLIEINPRISGGAMNKMLEAAFGFNLVKETIRLYTGGVPNITPSRKQHIYTHYVIVSEKGKLEKVTGKARARKAPGVVEVYVKPRKGTVLIPPLSMGHRYAYIIATGDTLLQARRNAEDAAKEITFHLSEEK
ncbi:ATP-grasp domain-containing protein [Sporosarcina cyprini]|uniref:ATP-grasp domain-containing protein n=1 Tax=Sporosarcina cyprini TaxID=2910523 RepID=UPI001EDEE007|nr:ATP-grasp domain-containing protein [Sporosarcina cyprini]